MKIICVFHRNFWFEKFNFFCSAVSLYALLGELRHFRKMQVAVGLTVTDKKEVIVDRFLEIWKYH